MNNATALRELRKSLKNNELPPSAYDKFSNYLNFTELKYITGKELKYAIIMHYAVNNEKSLLRFTSGLTDEQFDFARYEEYKIFRLTHKTDSWSEQFFKLKFGKDWQLYYHRSRNNRHNVYDVLSVAKRQNCSMQDAEKMVNQAKEKTKPSLEKFIQKYGTVSGTEKFYKLCRRHKNYIDYWINLYPNDLSMAQQKFKEYTSSSNIKHINFYLKREYTENEARKLISENQLNTAGVHRKYYENLGIPLENINKIMSVINKRKDSASINYIKSLNPSLTKEELLIKHQLHNLDKSSTYRTDGFLRKDDPDMDKRDAYYVAVDYYTKRSIQYMSKCPGKRGKQVGQFHVDHKFSKHEGFNNNIPPVIIGNVVNLQWLLAEENCSKRANCAFTKEELLLEYKNYENQIN